MSTGTIKANIRKHEYANNTYSCRLLSAKNAAETACPYSPNTNCRFCGQVRDLVKWYYSTDGETKNGNN